MAVVCPWRRTPKEARGYGWSEGDAICAKAETREAGEKTTGKEVATRADKKQQEKKQQQEQIKYNRKRSTNKSKLKKTANKKQNSTVADATQWLRSKSIRYRTDTTRSVRDQNWTEKN